MHVRLRIRLTLLEVAAQAAGLITHKVECDYYQEGKHMVHITTDMSVNPTDFPIYITFSMENPGLQSELQLQLHSTP